MTLLPTTYEEVCEILRNGKSLSIHSDDRDDALSLAAFNAILLYEPEEMIVKVQAGITLDALNSALLVNGQWIPTLVASEHPDATLGAAIANDRYHPRAATLGTLRTAILGGTFASADGTLFKSGSRVVKSVAGYDIHRAFCGSCGKFGAILDVTLKVQPLPERFVWFQTTSELAGHDFFPTISERIGNERFVELSGYTEDIEHDLRRLREMGLAEISEVDARKTIRQIISTARQDSNAEGIERIRNAFDPKGVLR